MWSQLHIHMIIPIHFHINVDRMLFIDNSDILHPAVSSAS